MRDSSRCPDPEVLAAFVAGTLSPDESRYVTEHLRTCDDCREIVREAAHADREHGQQHKRVAMIRPRRPSSWWLVAAASAVIGIVSVAVWQIGPAGNGGIETLVEAMPHDERYLEPRLTRGFPWAPLRSLARSNGAVIDPEQMKVIGAAGAVLEKNAGNPSVQSQYAIAIAHLVAGHTREAVKRLSEDVRSKPDARTWSDLSAAYYTLAVQTDDPAQFRSALSAADAALRLEPALPEALFNRALTIEHIGTPHLARAAWELYLRTDTAGPWAREARQHLVMLPASRD